MRTIPVDGERVTLVSTGKVMAKPVYEEGQKVQGRQASDDYGTPQWIVDCIDDSEETLRSEAIGVVVSSPVQPVLQKWRPVVFEGLVASVYRDKLTGQPKASFRASGIKES